jgi:hypothetical protein
MNKPTDARTSPRRPVSYEDVVDRSPEEDVPVWVSGVKARMYVHHPPWSEAVQILFEEPHSLMPHYGDQENDYYRQFRTKYFHIPEPGHLIWGKMDENIWIIEHRDE